MKKKYGIGFLIGTIVLTLISVCAFQLSYDRSLRRMEAQQKMPEQEHIIQTEGEVKKEEGYIIKEKDGFVIVYLSDEETVYEYTTIEVQYLPAEVQQELKKGKKVTNVKQVYGFLENYSS